MGPPPGTVLVRRLKEAGAIINSVETVGDAMAALASAARRVQAEYYIPHLAQAPMEPPAATARIVDGRCEVWAAVQAPQATRDRISKRLG